MAENGDAQRTRSLDPSLTFLLTVINLLLLFLLVYGLTQSPDASEAQAHKFTFQDAVGDALSLSADNAYDGLEPVTRQNTRLFWAGAEPDSAQVLVATWTHFEAYRKNVEKSMPISKPGGLWVTLVPQMQEACRRFVRSGSRLDRRLSQYLGLPLNTGYTFVAELWVDPDHLFRPCPDGEITDRMCNPGLPALPENADARALAHYEWFKKQLDGYYGQNPYPWTRYGYTYDWADPKRKVGASEYILREGSQAYVSSVTPTADYCSSSSDVPRNPPNPPPPAAPSN